MLAQGVRNRTSARCDVVSYHVLCNSLSKRKYCSKTEGVFVSLSCSRIFVRGGASSAAALTPRLPGKASVRVRLVRHAVNYRHVVSTTAPANFRGRRSSQVSRLGFESLPHEQHCWYYCIPDQHAAGHTSHEQVLELSFSILDGTFDAPFPFFFFSPPLAMPCAFY